MMTFAVRAAAAAALLGSFALAPSASASPVTMNFCVRAVGAGQYEYTFTLTLDNHDNTWSPGYGIGGIVFADSQFGPSPLDDFVGNPASFPIGPWHYYSGTNGSHNGTALGPVALEQPPYSPIYWMPTAIGDSLTWRGTSSHVATQLGWSALFTYGGPAINFQNMTNGSCFATGACCVSTGCEQLTAAQCATVGGTYHGDNTACTSCGSAGTCGSADFDCDGDTATDADIEAFFRCVAGTCPAAPCASTADFDGDGDSATDADIEAFFRVLAGGHC
jgi:hypothetical protein